MADAPAARRARAAFSFPARQAKASGVEPVLVAASTSALASREDPALGLSILSRSNDVQRRQSSGGFAVEMSPKPGIQQDSEQVDGTFVTHQEAMQLREAELLNHGLDR